jgi:hypothetical protein
MTRIGRNPSSLCCAGSTIPFDMEEGTAYECSDGDQIMLLKDRYCFRVVIESERKLLSRQPSFSQASVPFDMDHCCSPPPLGRPQGEQRARTSPPGQADYTDAPLFSPLADVHRPATRKRSPIAQRGASGGKRKHSECRRGSTSPLPTGASAQGEQGAAKDEAGQEVEVEVEEQEKRNHATQRKTENVKRYAKEGKEKEAATATDTRTQHHLTKKDAEEEEEGEGETRLLLFSTAHRTPNERSDLTSQRRGALELSLSQEADRTSPAHTKHSPFKRGRSADHRRVFSSPPPSDAPRNDQGWISSSRPRSPSMRKQGASSALCRNAPLLVADRDAEPADDTNDWISSERKPAKRAKPSGAPPRAPSPQLDEGWISSESTAEPARLHTPAKASARQPHVRVLAYSSSSDSDRSPFLLESQRSAPPKKPRSHSPAARPPDRHLQGPPSPNSPLWQFSDEEDIGSSFDHDHDHTARASARRPPPRLAVMTPSPRHPRTGTRTAAPHKLRHHAASPPVGSSAESVQVSGIELGIFRDSSQDDDGAFSSDDPRMQHACASASAVRRRAALSAESSGFDEPDMNMDCNPLNLLVEEPPLSQESSGNPLCQCDQPTGEKVRR